MQPPLADAELIELVQAKTPDELTETEIEQLRERLVASPQLREALITQLHMESYLNTALGEFQAPLDSILERVAEHQKRSRFKKFFGWFLTLALLGTVGGTVWYFNRPQPDPREIVAVNPPEPEPEEPTAPAELAKPPEVQPAEPAPAEPIPDPPPDEVPAEPKLPEGIWTNSLAATAPVRDWQETRFAEGWLNSRYEFPADKLQEWLTSAPNYSQKITENKWQQNQRFAILQGMSRLKAPWPDDAVLKLGVFDTDRFHIHLWTDGNEGVSLAWIQNNDPPLWAVYRVIRDGDKARPEKRTDLLTTDSGRWRRTEFGPFELRWQAGQLVMSRGGVRMLTVPFSRPPREVYFDAEKVVFSLLEMYRGTPLPEEPEPNRPLVADIQRPEELVWKTQLRDGSSFVATAADGLQLSSLNLDQNSWAATPLPRSGLHEVVARIESGDFGTGIYLGDEQGEPLHRVGFFLDRPSKQKVLWWMQPRQDWWEFDRNAQNEAVPWVSGPVWVKMIYGLGVLKYWISPDGKRWGQATHYADRYRNVPPSLTVGVYALRGEQRRSITVTSLQVRELPLLTEIIPAELRDHPGLVPFRQYIDYSRWTGDVAASIPPGVSWEDWRRACAWTTLVAGHHIFPREAMDGLLDEMLSQDWPLDKKLQFLEEFELVSDLQDDHALRWLVGWYEQLAMEQARVQQESIASEVMTRLAATPFWSRMRSTLRLDRMIGDSLTLLVAQHKYAEAAKLVREFHYWNRSANPNQRADHFYQLRNSLIEWGETVASWNLTDDPALLAAENESEWRHRLYSEFSKEGYNLMAEFEAAVRSEAYEDACLAIASAGNAGLLGLLPDTREPDLLVSLPNAVALAMEKEPRLRAIMRTEQGPLGMVRVRESIQQNNPQRVEMASVQFYGTPAAATAHAWLGDRAMSTGRFSQAAEHYLAALRSCDPLQEQSLRAAVRLAAAMQGEQQEAAPVQPVTVGGQNYAPAEFESLVASLLQSQQATASGMTMELTETAAAVPPPARYRLEDRAGFNGDFGQKASDNFFRQGDWVARQMAVAVDEQRFYVSNRFQVIAYDSQTGQERWATRLGDDQGYAHGYPWVPAQPLLLGPRLYVRRLTKRGFELACLEKETGKLLWKNQSDGEVMSDPVLSGQKLVAMVATLPQRGLLQLELASFHPDNGEVLSQKSVARFRYNHGEKPCCSLRSAGGRLIAAINGTVLCCDPLGETQWVRRQPWISPIVDQQQFKQSWQPPLVREDRVYTTQPGVKQVQCLDLQSGRQVWTRVLPGIERLLGLEGKLLLAQHAEGVLALSRDTGEIVWRTPLTELLDGHLCGGGKLLLLRNHLEGNQFRVPVMVWLDPLTGQELSSNVLSELDRNQKQAMCGPLVSAGGKLWGFWQPDKAVGQRLLKEFIATEFPSPGPTPGVTERRWLTSIAEKSQVNVAVALPGWEILTPQNFPGNSKAAPLEDYAGEKQTLHTRTEGIPVRFLRRLAVPAEGNPKLRLKVARGGEDWTLRVLIDGGEVLKTDIDAATAPNNWRTVDVDLSPHKGQTVSIVLAQSQLPDKKTSDAWWKQAVLVTE